LALYDDDQPAAEAEDARPPRTTTGADGRGGGTCRLGDLLRQCNTGVKGFMEHLTLVAGRLPGPLSARLDGDLRVMKEGIVVTKMLYGKYRQIWNERDSLFPPAIFGPSSAAFGNDGDSNNMTNGVLPSQAAESNNKGGGGGGDTSDDHDISSAAAAAAGFPLPLPPSDPQALPRLGWYLYLLTKDVLGFRSSNAAFVRCLNLVLAALGAVVWNSSSSSSSSSSPRGCYSRRHSSLLSEGTGASGRLEGGREVVSSPAAGSEPTTAVAAQRAGNEGGEAVESQTTATGGGGGGGDGGGGTYGGEAALLAKLSASGRCPAKEVRAMSAHVVEVIEALLQEGIVVSHHAPAPATSSPCIGGEHGTAVATAAAAAADVSLMDTTAAESSAAPVDVPRHQQLASRAERVAGVFHPSVAGENVDRLDACYWARVSQRGGGGGGGHRGVVLDEAFVLTPDLRDTVGTPRYGGSTPRRSALTPSVSRTSRQLFQDYQRVSNATAVEPLERGEGEAQHCLALSFGPPEDNNGPSASSAAAAAAAAAAVAAVQAGSPATEGQVRTAVAAAAVATAAGSFPESILPPGGRQAGGGSPRSGGVGGGGFGILRNPLASRSSRLGGATGMAGIAVGGGGGARGGPPETPVMAVME
ncbi:unnamed protein product, partial [Ectocarpus sp. 13 AM-2016]